VDTQNESEIWILVPPEARYLRALRLVAAEAGGRAGLSVSEVDDLRIAVGELCQLLMDSTDNRLAVRIAVHGKSLTVRASAPRTSSCPAPRLSAVSELIVDAVSDHYCVDHSPTEASFVLSKTAGRLTVQ
jgi:hypothetical protein